MMSATNGSGNGTATVGTDRVKQGLAQMLKGGVIVSEENRVRVQTRCTFGMQSEVQGLDSQRMGLLYFVYGEIAAKVADDMTLLAALLHATVSIDRSLMPAFIALLMD
jgi:hypothetical protein